MAIKPTAVGVRRTHPPLPLGGGLPSTLALAKSDPPSRQRRLLQRQIYSHLTKGGAT